MVDSLNDNCGVIDVFIGFDYYWEIVSGEIVCGDCGLMVVLSKFGWFLFGLLCDFVILDIVMFNLIILGDCFFVLCENDELISNFERFWEIEFIGI